MFKGNILSADRSEAFRILIADDEPDALDEYALALGADGNTDDLGQGLADLETELFGGLAANLPNSNGAAYELELCQQGSEALEAVRVAIHAGRPFAVAFLDVRMPPGPDGVATAERIRALDPNINIVFVTGYADLHPDSIAQRVTPVDKLLYCQKPVQATELQQFARALTSKWQAERNLVTMAQDLLADKERLQHLLISSPAVTYSCVPEGDFAATFVSDNVESILGYPANAILSEPRFWLDHIHPEDLPDIRTKIDQLFRRQRVVIEYRFQHQDGGYRWLLDELSLVHDMNGDTVEMVGCCIDITERKRRGAHQVALTELPIRVGELCLDCEARKVYLAGEEISLTNTEYELLATLIQHAGKALSRGELLSLVWHTDRDPLTNVVDVYVRHLRRKISAISETVAIETIRGHGYRLLDPRASEDEPHLR